MTESFLAHASEHPSQTHLTAAPGTGQPHPPAGLERQPIADRHGRLVGCELRLSQTPHAPNPGHDEAIHAATAIWIILHELIASSSTPRQTAFFHVSPDLLGSCGINLLPCAPLILLLDYNGQPDAQLIDRCRTLRERGFALALANYSGLDQRSQALLSLLSSVSVNLRHCNPRACRDIAGSLASLPITLLAQGIESAEQMTLCQRLGFTYFQGPHIARSQSVSQTRHPLSRPAVLRLLQLVDRQPELNLIENALKRETALLYHLLCLSLSFRDQCLPPHGTLRSVLVSIGQPALASWLREQLTRLEAEPHSASPPDLTLQLAALRGRTLELLAQRLEPNNPRLADAAFLAGSLSMLVKESELPGGETATLHSRPGQLGQLLDILDAFDRADGETCEQRLKHASRGRWGYPLIDECFSAALSWLGYA